MQIGRSLPTFHARRTLVLISSLLLKAIAFPSATALAQAEFPKSNSLYKSGSFPSAYCKSWNGTITEIRGINTGAARMSGVVTKDDIMEYCSRWASKEEAKQTACFNEEATRLRGEFSLTSTANCRVGRIKTVDDKEYQLRGLSSLWSNEGYSLTWQHVRTGEILDGSCASGAPPITKQFTILCPASVEHLIAPLRSYLDESYWTKFWKVDQRGIHDINQRKSVLSILNPEEGIRSARIIFQEQKVTTAQEYSTKQILTYNMIFKSNGYEIYRLEVDQSDRRRGTKLTKLIVSSPNISDVAGVRVGVRLIDVTSYNWRKFCIEEEAQVNCRSPYSNQVTYTLESDVVKEKTSVQSILRKSKVKGIEVDALN